MNIRRFFTFAAAMGMALLSLGAQEASADKRPRIAVLSFPVAEGAWEGWGPGGWQAGEKRISSALQELMITELMEAGDGRIRLMDRQRLQTVLDEQKFSNSGMVDESTAVTMGKMVGVRFMVTGKVTRFAYKKSGFDTSWGVGALLNKVAPNADSLAKAAASSVSVKKASFSGRLDVRVIDVQTGEIVAVAKDDNSISDVGVKVMGTGNEIQWDQELVNKVFEPIVKKLSKKLVIRMTND